MERRELKVERGRGKGEGVYEWFEKTGSGGDGGVDLMEVVKRLDKVVEGAGEG